MLSFCNPLGGYGGDAVVMKEILVSEEIQVKPQPKPCRACGAGYNPPVAKFCCMCSAPLADTNMLAMVPFNSVSNPRVDMFGPRLGTGPQVLEDTEPPPLPDEASSAMVSLRPWTDPGNSVLWTKDGIDRLSSNPTLYGMLQQPTVGSDFTDFQSEVMLEVVDAPIDELVSQGVISVSCCLSQGVISMAKAQAPLQLTDDGQQTIYPQRVDDPSRNPTAASVVKSDEQGNQEIVQTVEEQVQKDPNAPKGIEIMFWHNGKTYPITFSKKPLGIRWVQRPPVRICEVIEGSHAEDLGVKKDWVVKSVEGIDCCGKSYRFTSKVMYDAFAQIKWSGKKKA